MLLQLRSCLYKVRLEGSAQAHTAPATAFVASKVFASTILIHNNNNHRCINAHHRALSFPSLVSLIFTAILQGRYHLSPIYQRGIKDPLAMATPPLRSQGHAPDPCTPTSGSRRSLRAPTSILYLTASKDDSLDSNTPALPSGKSQSRRDGRTRPHAPDVRGHP